MIEMKRIIYSLKNTIYYNVIVAYYALPVISAVFTV